ncbi:Large-conductance mechanosensitive channel [Cardinium endosymbiont cEper1 of Encarsia pergandiella]|uniref:large conductance mechanosensitive channel protein MscL n=1 Tax=Cardinium endosymbiont of Encarsia pergandiella TaxID=249402 RepID=UPI00027E9AFF|nr:large conductance mechanosensitive channel protein MscL [Cardinium endosymbiont of Encarsia pergandiella]CCM10536.1 Large-conductance mechanosensitive channel [Cardinium endosymbiont cEper1 of Encarsia pergandiella]
MSFIKEFKRFAFKGNVIDLSVGVIIGGAFGKMVTAVVEDLFMPMVHPLLAKADQHWSSIVIGPGIKIGHFAAALLNFFVISLVVFILVKVLYGLKESDEEVNADTSTEKLLREIRDALKK